MPIKELHSCQDAKERYTMKPSSLSKTESTHPPDPPDPPLMEHASTLTQLLELAWSCCSPTFEVKDNTMVQVIIGTSNKVKMTECDGDIRKEDGACVLQTRKLFEKDKNQRPRASINITRLNPRRKLSRILSEVETLVSFMSDKYSVDQAQAFLIHIEKWKNKLKAMEGRFREGVVINIPTCDSVLLGCTNIIEIKDVFWFENNLDIKAEAYKSFKGRELPEIEMLNYNVIGLVDLCCSSGCIAVDGSFNVEETDVNNKSFKDVDLPEKEMLNYEELGRDDRCCNSGCIAADDAAETDINSTGNDIAQSCISICERSDDSAHRPTVQHGNSALGVTMGRSTRCSQFGSTQQSIEWQSIRRQSIECKSIELQRAERRSIEWQRTERRSIRRQSITAELRDLHTAVKRMFAESQSVHVHINIGSTGDLNIGDVNKRVLNGVSFCQTKELSVLIIDE